MGKVEAGELSVERLVAELQALPPGSLVPRDWVLGRLSEPPTEAATPLLPVALTVDLTVDALAALFGKRPSTVRAWIERGDFPGSYKLHGKEWRGSPSPFDAFHQRQARPAATPQGRATTHPPPRRTAPRAAGGAP